MQMRHRSSPLPPLTQHEQLDKDMIGAVYDEDVVHTIAYLEKGANPNARGYWDKQGRWDERRHDRVWEPAQNTNGPTALMLAAFTGRVETISALLNHGADINAPDGDGNSALMVAVMYGKIEAAYLLLDHGANAQANIAGADPLSYAVEETDIRLVRRLIAAGARVNTKGLLGDTALMRATRLVDAPMVRELLNHGADINAKNDDGETALMLAVKAHGGAERRGAAIVDLPNIPPLQKVETVRALLEKGADVALRDNNGQTALSSVWEPSKSVIVDLLKKAGAKT